MKNLKVIVVDSLIDNEYTICICSGLSNAGIDVHLIVPENKHIRKSINFTVKHWAPTKDFRANKIPKIFNYVVYLTRLAKFVFTSKDRIVHFQFFRNERIESIYFVFLKLIGIKLIYTAHNLLPHESKLIDPYLKKMVYNSSKAIIVHSAYIKQQLIKQFSIKESKIHVIHHGNFDVYLPKRPISKADARKYFGLSEDDQVLLFFGKIREYKGLDILLEAFELAAGDNPKLRLLIGGSVSAELLRHYQKIISQLRSKKQIIFHAKHIPDEEVAFYLLSTDVVMLPYKHIYHSGVLHVALPFAKPIIATRVGDLPEFIEDGKTGFLTEPNDPQKLMKSIKKAFKIGSNLDEMSKYIKIQNQTDYSWNSIGKKTAKLYQQLA